MNKEFDSNYVTSENDFIDFEKNCKKIVESCKASIKKYKGTYYKDFYNYILNYTVANERILAKYELLELLSSLTKDDLDIQSRINIEYDKTNECFKNLDGWVEFLVSLRTTNEDEELSKKAMLENVDFNDNNDFDLYDIKDETTSLESAYFNRIESYFDNLDESIEAELNTVLSHDEKEKYLINSDQNGNSFFRSKMSLFDDIILTSDNSDARNIAGNVLGSICSEKDDNYNGEIVTRILANRLEEAEIAGYKNYFEYKKDIRILDSKDNVEDLLTSVLKNVKPKAKRELEQLRGFVKNNYDVDNIKLNDLSYYVEKYKESKYNEIGFNINDYFTIESSIQGGIDLVEKIFGIKFVENKKLLDNNNILCFDVYVDNKIILNAFFDLYERPEKQISGFVSSLLPNVNDQVGVIYMSCCFSDVLSLRELENYLHELGHCVHDAFLKTNFYNVMGTDEIEQDLIEIPSMTFEKFLFNKDFFEIVKKKKEILDYDLINNAFDIYNFFNAYEICKQISYAYCDLELHTLERYYSLEELGEMFEDIVNRCIPAGMYRHNNNLYCFEHIFSNGYETTYYGYVLSDCYGALCYSKLVNDPEYAKTFRTDFLEKQKSEDYLYFINKNKDDIYEKLNDYYNI